jgi:hypothetical protein
MTVRPVTLLYRGLVEASAFLFDTRLLGEAEAQRRVLRLWSAGAVVHRLNDGLLLRLPIPIPVRCDRAPGMPLVASEGLLLATPLHKEERAALKPPDGAAVFVRDGKASVQPLAGIAQEDPALWLDVSDWRGERAQTLGAPPPPPQDAAPTPPFDPRAATGLPPEDPDRAAVLEAIRQAAQRPASGGGGAGGEGGLGELGEQVAGWLGRIAGRVVDATSGSSDGVSDFAHRMAMRLLTASGMAGVVGRRQAEYLARMMEMFERGDLDQALRHAISLSEMEGKSKLPFLGLPDPRNDLSISMQRASATSDINVSPELYEHLMGLYVEAFHKLESQGRIEEAAFVLAELLEEYDEAIAFLERHNRYKLAGEIAEGHKLPPGLVVRLWFLAGDKKRAIRVARRTGAFADAILRLERDDKEKAMELRLLWAAARATTGDYVGAVEVTLPVLGTEWDTPEVRDALTSWMDSAIELGGAAGARMLARKLSLVPEAEAETREKILALLADENPETAAERLAFASALCAGKATPQAKTLARAAARVLLRDAGESRVRIDSNAYQRLLRFAGDGPLRADAPALPIPERSLSASTEPFSFTIATADTGSLPVSDVGMLPDGRCVVGFGEAGARLLTRDGRTVVHWEQPAHRLVMSDQGNAALALAPRGEVWRIGRLDFETRKGAALRDLALRAFAPDYDGSLWFVAFEKDFLALDATTPSLGSLWRLPNLTGGVQSIARSSLQCSFLLFSVGVADEWGRPTGLWTRLESWTHALPGLFLSERKDLTAPPETTKEGIDFARTISPGGTVFALHVVGGEINVMTNRVEFGVTLVDSTPGFQRIGNYSEKPIPFPPVIQTEWLLLPLKLKDGVECRLIDRRKGTLRAQFRLDGAEHIAARFALPYLVLGDDRGRLLVFDLERGEITRNLRL